MNPTKPNEHNSDAVAQHRQLRDRQRLSKSELDACLDRLLNNPAPSQQCDELQRILHELYVHQIELEIQNRELRDSQQRLEEARDRYADLYDFSPVGYLTLNSTGKILGINLRGAAMLGRERGRLIGTPLAPLLWTGESRILFSHLSRAFQSTEKVTDELKLKLPGRSREPVTIRIASVPVIAASGEVATCNSAIIEITEQKSTEAALRAERDRAQSYLDTVEDIIVALDANGNIGLLNRKGCELLGCSESTAIGENWFAKYLPASERDRSLALFRTIMVGGIASGEYFENLVVCKNGNERLISWHNGSLRDESGNIVGTLSAGEDITERRRTERALNGQHEVLVLLGTGASLEDVLHKLVAVAEKLDPNVTCSVLMLSEDGKTLRHGAAPSLPDYFNKAVEGMEVGACIACCGSAAFQREPVIVEDVLTHPNWANYRELVEEAGLRACWSVPILSTSGELLGTVANYYRHPHTPTHWELDSIHSTARLASIAIERWRTDNMARQHQAELAHMARLNTMGEMATGMAHELNQPLTAVATYTDVALRILKSSNPPPEKIREALQGAREQALRASEIIRHLRQLVRKQPPQKKDIDINALIQDVVGFVAFETQRQRQKLILLLSKNLPPVSADAIQVEQVLLNLIRNSLEAMQGAMSKTQKVTLSTVVNSDGMVQITVADTGPGIDAETMRHLFEPFITTKGAAGMGMGLSICRSIVASHGGRLWADSTHGQGATLHLTLPPVAKGTQP